MKENGRIIAWVVAVATVAILVGSAPLMTAILVGAVSKEERLTLRGLGGSLLAFAGKGSLFGVYSGIP